MKRVLIITYYWPPSGGGGVQRWLKFVKYLREFGWEPVVYTPENPEAPAIDYSLKADIPDNLTVIKIKIWEPYSFYKKITGLNPDNKIKTGFLTEKKKPSLTENISVWIRGNFFIPDARKFWIKPSVRFLSKYLTENPVNAIISTGPPHSMHMIALGIKQNLGIPWLADFRDPWTNIDFYDQLKLSRFADMKHRRLEKKVLTSADKIITVSWNWTKDFEKLGAKNIEVITNGFDPDDFTFLQDENDNQKNFEICHIGSMNKDRNPFKLWEALKELCDTLDGFAERLKITFIGQTDISVKESLKENKLLNYTVFEEYKPHKEVLKIAKNATVLLLALNDTPNVEGIIPGKLFEYLALQRPVLCIGSTTGDSAKIIRETNSGVVVGFDRKKDIINFFRDMYKRPGVLRETNRIKIEKYSRKELTAKITQILDFF